MFFKRIMTFPFFGLAPYRSRNSAMFGGDGGRLFVMGKGYTTAAELDRGRRSCFYSCSSCCQFKMVEWKQQGQLEKTTFDKVRANSPAGRDSSVVMPLALKNLEHVLSWCDCADSKNYAVFLVDAYTPPAAEIASKRFGIADTSGPIAVNTLKKLINALESLNILRLPSKIFLPSVFMPDFTHEQTPRYQAVHVQGRFGRHSYHGRDVRVRGCCLRSRRDHLILQREAFRVGGIAV